MRCIFCLEEREPSDEHVFPLAIGGSLHTERVCTDCNSRLGSSVDITITEHPLILMRRYQLNLSGNSGNMPDVFKKIFGVGTLVDDATQKFSVYSDNETGVLKTKLIYNVADTPLENGDVLRQIKIDATDAEQIRTIIQRERKRAGQNPLTPEELQPQIDTIIANGKTSIEKPTLRHKLKFDTEEYKKGLWKIAYEFAFLWLGEAYLDDPQAVKIRDFILPPKGSPVKSTQEWDDLGGRATLVTESQSFMLWAKDTDSHIAYSAVLGEKIVINIKIFDVFSASLFVSDNKDRYVQGQYDANCIRFIRIDPVKNDKRESSFIDEIGSVALSLRSPL